MLVFAFLARSGQRPGVAPRVEITRVARQAALGGAQARSAGEGRGFGGRDCRALRAFPSSPPRRQVRPPVVQLAEVRQ